MKVLSRKKPGKSEELKQGQLQLSYRERTGNVTREWGTGSECKGRVCPAQGFRVGARSEGAPGSADTGREGPAGLQRAPP